jgi:hypothetical protein
MTWIIRVVRQADEWLIEFDGDHFGPWDSEDAAFAHANLTALKLQMSDFSSNVRIERRGVGR